MAEPVMSSGMVVFLGIVMATIISIYLVHLFMVVSNPSYLIFLLQFIALEVDMVELVLVPIGKYISSFVTNVII